MRTVIVTMDTEKTWDRDLFEELIAERLGSLPVENINVSIETKRANWFVELRRAQQAPNQWVVVYVGKYRSATKAVNHLRHDRLNVPEGDGTWEFRARSIGNDMGEVHAKYVT